MLYRLKYKGDRSTVPEIVETAVEYQRPQRSKFDRIVPVPPSRIRPIQPVIILAQGIGAALDLPVAVNCIGTTRPSGQLKDVSSPEERRALITGLHTADPGIAAQKNILLFEDLFRSSAGNGADREVERGV